MASELLRTQLPQPWNFGVTRDGRVFFINEESRSTTWLHPVYNHPVQSGNLSRQDLPKGWEQSFTPEGVPYYIDHTSLRTSFIHPITGQSALPVHDNNQGPGQNNQKQDHFKRASLRRKSNKQKVIDKLPVAKRSENSPVTHQGWLYKQDSGGLKGWKRRWFVLSDFCLFYYKSQLDTQTQGSVLLPSYKIDYCSREDGVNRKFSFKAEHQNMRTYYFAAESKQEQDAWMSCLSSATVLQQRAASGPGPDQVFPEDQDHGGFQVNPPAPYNTADNRISGGDPRGDPRFDPRADPRSNPGGPGQGYEPGTDTGGFGDSETPRFLPNEQNTPQGYDPRMNANPGMQPVMRNSYERPRSVPPAENRYSGQEWGNPRDSDPRFDPRFRDSYRGGDQDSLSSRGSNNMRPNRDYNYNVPEDRKPGPSYLGVASNGYNPQQDSSTLEQSNDDSMEKTLDRSFDSTQPIPGYDSFQQQRSLTGKYQVQDPQPGQYQMQDPQPGQYQARDSQQRPLSGQYQIQDPQPGQYKAQNPQQRPLSGQYQIQDPQPGQYQAQNPQQRPLSGQYQVQDRQPGQYQSQNPQQRPLSGQYQVEEPQLNRSVPSREASMSDMGRSDSLRHLQEWKNQQMRNPQRTPSGSTSPMDQPISDGRRQYTSSASSPRDGSSERSSSRNMPQSQSSLPRQGTTHRSPPPDPLKLDGFQQSGSSGSTDPAPNRPPIPAAYREQYIRELAETKTPHSRHDLLSSIDIQRQRQEEPLVFRYPEDERRQKAVPPRKEFVGEGPLAGRRSPKPSQNAGAPRYASPGPQPGPPKPGRGRNIETIKEDPNMSDQDILTTKTLAELEQHLSGHRMRLSIAATDLVGKTHEELVLLLIQLRRDQSKLERTKDFYRSKLDVGRPQEKDYKLKRKNSIGRLHEVVEREHDVYAELRKMYDELENQLEVTKPLVNLLDNMVRMGSLYGGDNMMLASQYKRHKILPEQYTPPKKMILFSRQHQEEKLSKEQEEELKQLMEDEVDLEEKLQQLYQLDRELQERSLAATNLQQSKDLLEKSVTQLRKDLLSTEDPRNLQRMKHQLRLLEAELLTVRQQLAETSRLLEETSAEDAKVENEVILLRKKIYGIGRSQSSPTMGNENIRARQQLEQELHGVQSVMEGLSKQGAALSDTIKALRHSTPDLTSSGTEKNNKTYLETDMDSGRSRDLAKEPSQGASPYTSVTQQSQVTKTERIQRTSEMYSRDRSKSEPPKVEEKIQQKSMPYTFQQRDASMVSQHASINSGSAANQWGPSQNGQGPGSDRNSLGSSQRRFEPEAGPNQSWGSSQERIGSARDPRGPSPHGSITRDQVPPGAENRGNQQYQQRVVEVQRSYQIQNGANSTSSSSSLDQQPNTYRPTGAPQTSQAHQEGVYHAEMRMVTPEPRDQYRYDYRGPRPGDLGSPSDSQNQEYDQRSASQQEKTFIKKHPDLAYSGKPTSEVKPQQQYRVQHVSMSSDMKTKDMEEANSYTPMELSEAEDNMKKFYGLIPKDAARTQTVRDVKKKENERRSRERKRFYVNVHGPADMEEAEEFDNNYGFQRSQSLPRRVSAPVYAAKKQSQDDSMSKRKSVGVYQAKKSVAESRASASERLFPKVSPSVSTEPQPGRIKSQEHVRRISDIFTPRPFGGSSNSGGSPWKRDDESKFGSSTSKLTSSATVATVRPVVNTNRGVDMTVTHAISTGSKSYTSNTAPSSTNGEVEIIRENARGKKYWEERLKQRHTPRGRFMTISSAQPTELEKEHVWKPSKLSSAAGDLISGRWLAGRNNYIQGEPLKALKFDELTIDREVLYVPDKVDIPERYIASDDEETEEEKQHRSDKGEQIKRMLAAQSLAEWKQEEVGMNRRGDSGLLHAHVQAERQRREQLLDLKQALAREVTQKSKQVAGMNQQQYSRGNEGPGRGQSAGGSLSPTYTSHTVIGSLSPPPDERGMMGYSSSRRIRTISR